MDHSKVPPRITKQDFALPEGLNLRQAAILGVSPPQTELTRVIARHDCGIWLRPRNAEALAGAIRRLYEDRELLARMKENARRAAVQYYSKEICVRQYLELLMPLLGMQVKP